MAKILAVLDDDATQAKLLAIVREVNALPPQQQQMQKMGRLFPAVQEATAPVLASPDSADAAAAVPEPYAASGSAAAPAVAPPPMSVPPSTPSALEPVTRAATRAAGPCSRHLPLWRWYSRRS